MNLSSSDALSLSLLSLAEYFRTCPKPKVRQILQCLFAILNIPNQSQRMEARTLMQIGLIYRYYTKNQDLARHYLEKAFSSSLTINQFEDVVGQCSTSLADLYTETNDLKACEDVISRGLEQSKGHLFFQCRLLFQISQLNVHDQDYDAACRNLTNGVELCRASNSFYLEALFLLSKAMIFMLKKQFQDLNDIFARCNQIMEHFDRISNGEAVVSSASSVFPRKDLLFTFSLALHVAHFTAGGQGKSAKYYLKQLQNSLQKLTSNPDYAYATHNTAEFFHWMHNDSLCILVYVLTVVNNVQCGLMEKALKYIDRAHLHIDKLCRSPLSTVEHNFLLSVRAILHENAAICRLVMGNNSLAIKDISLACQYCSANSKLLENHRPQLHTLLGMYCMSMNLLPNAESQFNTVLRITKCVDLWTYVNLNLSICYFNCGREPDFCTVLDRVTPEKLQTKSESIKAASCFVKGIQMFGQNRISESKRYLRDALALADKEDMNAISSCSLVLLGYLFLASSNIKDSLNMVNPAVQLARSMPDIHVHSWGVALLKDIYAFCKDVTKENECNTFQSTLDQMLAKDRYQSSILPEHQLVGWIDGSPPVVVGHNEAQSESSVTQEQANNLLDF